MNPAGQDGAPLWSRRQGNVDAGRGWGHGRETVTEGTTAGAGGWPGPADLLDEPARETVDAVAGGDARGPLAVVGSPFAGRRAVLDHLADRLDATRVHVGPAGPDPGGGTGGMEADDPDTGVDLRVRTGPDADEPGRETADAIADGGATVVSGCHHLYTRRVGGFEPLDTCLDAVAGADSTVVTGWNRYAWTYLAAVRDLDRTVPERVEVGPLDAAALSELLLARYDDIPTFERDDDLPLFTRRQVSVAGVDLWLPALDRAALAARRGGDPDPRDVVFERLAAVSEGNVGVATTLWERARGSEVRPSDVPDVDQPGLDRETAFCLRVVLASERAHRADLAAVVGDDTERALGRLRRNDLVTVDGDWVALSPAAVPTAVAETERERIL